MSDLRNYIRDVPDFPQQGIVFKDITTLLKNAAAFHQAVDELALRFEQNKVDKILGIESRGFIFAAALAYKWGKGVILARKPGKLPAEKITQQYQLEYGTDAIEMHRDAVSANERILIIDDLLATGGTVSAAVKLVEQLQGEVAGIGFLIELSFLHGREKLAKYRVESLIRYESE